MADVLKRHNRTYHLYVDDTRLYVSSIEIFCTGNEQLDDSYGLKLNEEKTELLPKFTLSAQSFTGICSCWG